MTKIELIKQYCQAAAPNGIWDYAHIHIQGDNQIVACIEGRSLKFTTHDVVCWVISKYQSKIIKLMYE